MGNRKTTRVVSNYVGYDRFTTKAEQNALAAVYRALCPRLNYFMPTVQLVNKTRVGAKELLKYNLK
jgi:hypothetical protein